MVSGSSSAFIFAMIFAGLPAAAIAASAWIASTTFACSVNGACQRCLSALAVPRPVSCLKISATSAPISSFAVSKPKSV